MTENKPDKLKFLVVSYDNDQQRWFYDFVVAHTEEEAEEKVNMLRSYVIASDAVALRELKGFAETLESKTFDQCKLGGSAGAKIIVINWRFAEETRPNARDEPLVPLL